jgi:chorismate synthase
VFKMLTAGESHGRALVAVLEGMPSGVPIDKEKIDLQMKRRQAGFGRGGRMKIECDEVSILSGIRFGKTLGSPIAMLLENKDWPNWQKRMDPFEGKDADPVCVPRPGHADFAGSVKYDHKDIRNVIERASARETAMRVALGAVLRQFLECFGVWIGSHVIRIGSEENKTTFVGACDPMTEHSTALIRSISEKADASPVRCGNHEVEDKMMQVIRSAMEAGDSVGGIFETAALNVPPGLGSYAFWDRRMDAMIAAAFMGIPGIKAVEIGAGFQSGQTPGSEFHDGFFIGKDGAVHRRSNRAGGIEGGVTNGMPVLVRAAMKPIPTLTKPLPSVHMAERTEVKAHQERSDVCAVPAAAVVGESMLAMQLAGAFHERFGGDSLDQIKKHVSTHDRP